MFDLTHRTEADGSVVARAEIPCTLHLTNSNFGNDFCWRETWKSRDVLGFALDPVSAAPATESVLGNVGGDGDYRPLWIDWDTPISEHADGMPPALEHLVDTYGVFAHYEGEEPICEGIDGMAQYVVGSGGDGVDEEMQFYEALTAAVKESEHLRREIEYRLNEPLNDALGSGNGLWNVEILEPVDGENKWLDTAFKCNIFYETRVQA